MTDKTIHDLIKIHKDENKTCESLIQTLSAKYFDDDKLTPEKFINEMKQSTEELCDDSGDFIGILILHCTLVEVIETCGRNILSDCLRELKHKDSIFLQNYFNVYIREFVNAYKKAGYEDYDMLEGKLCEAIEKQFQTFCRDPKH